MTVGELIVLLQEHPETAKIQVEGHFGIGEISEVEYQDNRRFGDGLEFLYLILE
jgi:hypothetical protein